MLDFRDQIVAARGQSTYAGVCLVLMVAVAICLGGCTTVEQRRDLSGDDSANRPTTGDTEQTTDTTVGDISDVSEDTGDSEQQPNPDSVDENEENAQSQPPATSDPISEDDSTTPTGSNEGSDEATASADETVPEGDNSIEVAILALPDNGVFHLRIDRQNTVFTLFGHETRARNVATLETTEVDDEDVHYQVFDDLPSGAYEFELCFSDRCFYPWPSRIIIPDGSSEQRFSTSIYVETGHPDFPETAGPACLSIRGQDMGVPSGEENCHWGLEMECMGEVYCQNGMALCRPLDGSPPSCFGLEQPLFHDVTEERGLTGYQPLSYNTDWYLTNESMPKGAGIGASSADFNGDGFTDVFFANTAGPDALFWGREGGTFERAYGTGLSNEITAVGSSSIMDYDQDGLVDIFLGSTGPTRIYRNNGDETFERVYLPGFERADGLTVGISFADPMGTGFTCAYQAYHFAGFDDHQRTFDDMACFTASSSYSAGWLFDFQEITSAFIGGWVDIDRDGDSDIWVVNDDVPGVEPRTHDLLYYNTLINDGSGDRAQLTLAEPECQCRIRRAGMGLGVADIDEDGRWDVLTSNLVDPPGPGGDPLAVGPDSIRADGSRVATLGGPNPWPDNNLMMQKRNGVFSDRGDERGIKNMKIYAHEPQIGRSSSWFLDFLDYDNDGYEDIYIANGPVNIRVSQDYNNQMFTMPHQPDTLLHNRGDGTFEDVSFGSGVEDTTIGRTALVHDYNRDGCLDIISVPSMYVPRLKENACDTGNHWVSFELRSRNFRNALWGLGARVELVAGGRAQQREIHVGSRGVHAAWTPYAHFGLGQLEQVDEVLVYWPSGYVESFAFDNTADLDRWSYLVEGTGSVHHTLTGLELSKYAAFGDAELTGDDRNVGLHTLVVEKSLQGQGDFTMREVFRTFFNPRGRDKVRVGARNLQEGIYRLQVLRGVVTAELAADPDFTSRELYARRFGFTANQPHIVNLDDLENGGF